MENESAQPGQRQTSPEGERKPWPMWPIVLSIFGFIVFYTWVQMTFRKEEKPFELNHAMQERRDKAAEKNLYGWFSLNVSPAARTDFDGLSSSGIQARFITGPLEKDLPSQIVYYIPRRPILVPELDSMASESSFSQNKPIRIRLSLPEAFGDSSEFRLASFYKEGELILLAEMRVENAEILSEYDARSPVKDYVFEIDSAPIEAERVKAKLYFEGQVREWTLERTDAKSEE